MMFSNKPLVIEAEQFWPDKPLPFRDRGPYVAFNDGRFYVITAHAQSVTLAPGDWVVLEPVGPHVPSFAAYPVKPDIFEARYEPYVRQCGYERRDDGEVRPVYESEKQSEAVACLNT